MEDLKLETAEPLPSRETFWSSGCCHGGGITNLVAGNGGHHGDGDTLVANL